MTKEKLIKKFVFLYHKDPIPIELSQFKKSYLRSKIPMCFLVKYGVSYPYNSYRDYYKNIKRIRQEEIINLQEMYEV